MESNKKVVRALLDVVNTEAWKAVTKHSADDPLPEVVGTLVAELLSSVVSITGEMASLSDEQADELYLKMRNVLVEFGDKHVMQNAEAKRN